MVSSAYSMSARRPIEKWTLWVLLATIAGSVLLVTPFLDLPVIMSKTYLIAAGSLVSLALFIVARLSRGNVILPPLVLVGALWLPVIAYALSALFGGTSFGTAFWGTALEMDTLGVMLAVATLGTLVALVVGRREQYSTFLRIGLVVYFVVAVLQAAVLVLGQIMPDSVSPAFSLLGSYENAALFLGLGVIGGLIAFRFMDLAERTKKLLYIASACSLLILAIANSTFVWSALALASVGFFIESAMLRKSSVDQGDEEETVMLQEEVLEEENVSYSIVPALAVLAVSIFFLVGSQLGGALANSLNVSVLSVSPSWQSTLSVAGKSYSTSPIFGTGPGSFGSEWLKYRDAALNETLFWNVDFVSGIGVIPTSMVTTGLVGVIAWVAFFILFVGLGLRMLIVRTPEDPFIRAVAVFSFVGAVYLFAAAIFRLPNAVLFMLAFVFAGLFASTVRYGRLARQQGVVFARSPRVGFIIVFMLTLVLFGTIVASYSLVGRYVANSALMNASVAFNQGDVAQATSSIGRSIEFAPSARAYQAQANIAIVELSQIAASTTMKTEEAREQFQNILSSGINSAITATQLEPQGYQNWITLGNLYAQAVPLNVSGAYESAMTAYEKARELHPTSPEILYTIARINLSNKDLDAARENLKATIALKRDYTAAIFLLSQVEVQSGNVKEALQIAEAAKYFAPKDPNVLFQLGVLQAATGLYAGSAISLEEAVSANPQFANARYFLAAVYAKQSNLEKSIEQLVEVSKLSSENAAIVEPLIADLEDGKNPFPANLLSIEPEPVQETQVEN